MAYLGDKAVGSTVKLNVNGTARDFIIVHQGKPSSLYDSSCDGTWLLMKDIYETNKWGANNDYKNSDIHTYLNGTFLNLLDSNIKAAIKQAKIPYQNGAGSGSSIASGSSGLSAKIFLLSGYEVGFSTAINTYYPVDGAKLSYFSSGTDTAASNKRIANYEGSATIWWLRSPAFYNTQSVWLVNSNGGSSSSANSYGYFYGVRPAFVLPSTLLVGEDGTVSTNTLPTITADKTGDLGTLTDGFTCNYSVNDEDADDNVTVTLSMDDTTIKTFAATKNKQETYSLTGNEWLKTTNGEHTFTISASDGKDTATNTITFTRNLTELTVALEQPFPADDVISACALNVEGSIPADAVCKYEVTNNALDSEPVWEDCTKKSQAGFSYVFTNKTAENGFAFNFRVTISRGASGSGGYITSISGGFE